MKKYIPPNALLQTDGGSRGNPGESGYGAILTLNNGQRFTAYGYIGIATNFVAEYQGIIGGLKLALAHNVQYLTVQNDSMVVINQLKGACIVRAKHLVPLHGEAKSLSRQFKKVVYEHIGREKNKEADALANLAQDTKSSSF